MSMIAPYAGAEIVQIRPPRPEPRQRRGKRKAIIAAIGNGVNTSRSLANLLGGSCNAMAVNLHYMAERGLVVRSGYVGERGRPLLCWRVAEAQA